MKRSSEMGSPPEEKASVSEVHPVAHNDVPVSVGEMQITNPTLVIETNEVVHIHEEHSTVVSQELQDSIAEDANAVIAQYMDITEPLTTLKALLEQRLGLDLSEYSFYLQETQELDASKNLVNQCVQGEGIVQINVEIIEKDGVKKINIVDVLKPADEVVDNMPPDNVQQVSAEEVGEPPVVRKVVIPITEESENVTRWIVSPEFRQIQDQYKIPLDAAKWTEAHVQHWIEWAAQHFSLQGINMNDWNITGKQLCNLNHLEFMKKVPCDPGDLFWTHLELLRKCKIVAVIQQPTYVQHFPQMLTAVTKNLAFKNRIRSPRIGAPRVAYEGCPGNNGQIQLWQFLLELLTDKDQRECIQWVGEEGEFKLINPEVVAQLWGQRKNKPTMNYEKLSRALRYYYDGEMIAKVHGKRFVYKFVCDLKSLLGYDAAELNRLVMECEHKKVERMHTRILPFSSVDISSAQEQVNS